MNALKFDKMIVTHTEMAAHQLLIRVGTLVLVLGTSVAN